MDSESRRKLIEVKKALIESKKAIAAEKRAAKVERQTEICYRQYCPPQMEGLNKSKGNSNAQ